MNRPPRRLAAVFLDRDGTVIEDRDYPSDPDGVRLLPGAARAVARLNREGIRALLVTNQSGIGRGYMTEQDFHRVQQRVEQALAEQGARLDGVYYCPHAPDHEPPCECRKPRPGLFRRAAAEHGFDPADAAFVGDRARDVLPGLELGGAVFLVGRVPANDPSPPDGVQRLPSLEAAVDRLLGAAG